jgi:hypothetical protein
LKDAWDRYSPPNGTRDRKDNFASVSLHGRQKLHVLNSHQIKVEGFKTPPPTLEEFESKPNTATHRRFDHPTEAVRGKFIIDMSYGNEWVDKMRVAYKGEDTTEVGGPDWLVIEPDQNAVVYAGGHVHGYAVSWG